MDAGKLIEDSNNKPISVNLVKVEGVVHTNYDFLEHICKDLLLAQTVGDVIIGSRNIGNQLKRLGIFSEVAIVIDSSPDKENSLDIIYNVVEAPRIFARTGAEFGNDDSNMNIALAVRNLFGNAESLSGKSSYGVENEGVIPEKDYSESRSFGMQGASAHELTFTKPLYGNPDDSIEITAYKTNRSLAHTLSCQETDQGFSLSRICLLGIGQYKVSYQATWRENHSFHSNASKSARKEAGHSLKSSIQHQYSFDTRNEQVFPSKGAYFKILQELAGLGGDVQFLKNELHSQVLMELPKRMVLSLAFRGGFLLPLSENSSTFPRANDRFYLGGPLTLRGFKYGGVGPRVSGNSLGGSAYNAVGIDFTFPLPYLPIDYIRGHLFFNSGSLVPIDNLAQNKVDFFKNPSSSIGFGIIARFTSFRLEANYCIPIRSTITDSLKPGLQFGVGMHFM